eukprot:1149834-Pelagomonas_calceolata.AAC.6
MQTNTSSQSANVRTREAAATHQKIEYSGFGRQLVGLAQEALQLGTSGTRLLMPGLPCHNLHQMRTVRGMGSCPLQGRRRVRREGQALCNLICAMLAAPVQHCMFPRQGIGKHKGLVI